jgi:hypothetical protein
MFVSLRHVEDMCFSERHNWQRLLVVAKNVVLGPALPSVPFPKKLMRVSFKTWSCQSMVDSPNVVSSCSSFMGSYGVSSSSPNTHSISTTTKPPPQCQCRSRQRKVFLFLALVLSKNCNVVLHPIFDLIEKSYPTFHSIFELFPLVLV